MIKVGIIGGSGIDILNILENSKSLKVHTPYGATSGIVKTGQIKNVDVVIITRHGPNHSIKPTLINYRANIYAMKKLRVTHIIAPTACGSLRKKYKPGELVFIDQFIDRTSKRKQSFYEGTQVCHIPMAEPFCFELRNVLKETAQELNISHHEKGTMVTIEGPRFSTRAESKMFRLWGGDTINMTTVPEAVLAREAGICYSAIAMVTDYDCWHESEESVTLNKVLATMKKNADNVLKLILESIPKIHPAENCFCPHDIKTSLL